MIFSLAKRFQITLWADGDRSGSHALQLEFDNRDEAERALAEKEREGVYRVGILVEWDKRLNDWTLLKDYSN